MDRAPRVITHGAPEGSDDDEDQVAADLEEARARLHASLSALHTRWGELRDGRAWIRRHPLPFAVGAFGLGVLLGWRRRS